MSDEKTHKAQGPGHAAVLEREEPWEDDGAVSLSEILSMAYRRKRFVLALTVAGGAIAAAIAFMVPNVYTSSAIIVPPQKEQSAASMLAGQLGPLAAVAGTDLGLKSPSDLYIALLGSRTIADDLIERFGLKAVYDTRTFIDTRKKLQKRSQFSSVRNALIRIDVDDRDPNRAAAMANAYVAELDAQNRKLSVTESSQRREFFEKQLANERAALAVAEDAMKKTQQKTGVIDVSGQTQVAIASLAQIRAQITASEVSLERLKMGATSENPEVVQMEAQLAALRTKLQGLGQHSEHGDPLMAASAIPENGLDYVRSLRDLKYHEFLFELLSKQYEAARIDESKATPALQVVDAAVPPDKKSWPPRALIISAGCVIGIGVAMLVAFLQWRKSAHPELLRS